ncbi:DUF72 domain-containing protein [Kineobactrum sediminis]|uniref:DUF72 domain-containing protein n=1 Tax=Kineobactrum sediminis TaxID=1905677 RepID=A0A2N5Y221_9GAMM|nr:DUF72 domain-containing protein [Kineobactrum sediminis]PLW82435.1 DUF72 domain-containing protein [Kineobactrum sediminis]
MKAAPVHVGTSGWHYEHWQGPFYPKDLATGDWLEYYASQFSSLEINNAFYRLPAKKTLQQWHATVPENFIFTAKASRYITHMKKLKDPEESIAKFFDHIVALEEKLGAILFQLPPRWKFNADRLKEFLNALSRDFRYAFEFRDHSWINEESCDLLSQHNAAFCLYDLEGFVTPAEITADFVYIRLHGPGAAYQGDYNQQSLSEWAEKIRTWSEQGKAVYCYFDNDEAGYAAKNAKSLRQMLE